MRGGVVLFRGAGADARRYLEKDRAKADDYYLEDGAALAEFSVVNGAGAVLDEGVLSAAQYSDWVDWKNPVTGEIRGVPRVGTSERAGSPRFAEMVVNVPKSLSVAAALHPEISAALDLAQADAVSEIRGWLGEHSVTRVGPRGAQEVVHVDRLETVGVVHRTSRAGDPHRHIHLQVGARVFAAGKWRGLDTAALFKQQGAIRALGSAVIAAHPELAATLDRHGLTLNPVTGEVVELEQFNKPMSKRGVQVAKKLEEFEGAWRYANPGQEPGPVVTARWQHLAWSNERPGKKPTELSGEAGWVAELRALGYDETRIQKAGLPVQSLDELSVEAVAKIAVDRCAAGASTWTRHTVQENVTLTVTESGVRATPQQVREFVELATRLATDDCLSVLPSEYASIEHVAHLTSVQVIAVETELRDRVQARSAAPKEVTRPVFTPDVSALAYEAGLDDAQSAAAAAVASSDPLVIVEGAAGAGKTTMLGVAIAAVEDGVAVRIVTPTLRAAQVAGDELGVEAHSVAKLVHEYGWRWNKHGVWSRLQVGQIDPQSGREYRGPSDSARIKAGDRIVVDEAGMLDQDTALALFTLAHETGAGIALVGDRAQLAAVGRGGVLDIAADIRGTTFDMNQVHRFTNPEYAGLTLAMRAGENPDRQFDQLRALGLVDIHASEDAARLAITLRAGDRDAITVASNDEAQALNESIREGRVIAGTVDDTITATGRDGLKIGAGDVIQTRQNDAGLHVTNRATWRVQSVEADGSIWVASVNSGRKANPSRKLPTEYVTKHTHLAYASTAYGVQGATVTTSHTLLSDALSASGVYVGMTRGREENRLHIVAENIDEARAMYVAAQTRDTADRGLNVATERAREAVAGLSPDAPDMESIEIVSAARDRLIADAVQHETDAAQAIEHAENLERRITEYTHRVEPVTERHQVTNHRATEAVQEATAKHAEREAYAVQLEAEGAERATIDGQNVIDSQLSVADATEQVQAANVFNRRGLKKEQDAATEQWQEAHTHTVQEWGSAPEDAQELRRWAARMGQQYPRAVEARQSVEQAREHVTQAEAMRKRQTLEQRHEIDELRREVLGTYLNRNLLGHETETPLDDRTAAQWAKQHRENAETHLEHARDSYGEAAELKEMSVEKAVQKVSERENTATGELSRAEQVIAEMRTRRSVEQQHNHGPQHGIDW